MTLRFALLFTALVFLLGCGDDKSKQTAASRATSALEASEKDAREDGPAAEAKVEEGEVKAIPTALAPDVLRTAFRSELSGVRQSDISTDTQTVKGAEITVAKRQYKGRRRSAAEIEIFDLAARAAADDFEPPFPTEAKAIKKGEPMEVDGHPGRWQYKRRSKAGQAELLVGGRFYIRAKTKRFEKDTVQRLITKAIDIAALENAP